MTTLRKRGAGMYYLDQEPVPSVTTVLDNGYPKKALVGWAAKSVAQAAVDEWDTLGALGVGERYERLKAAPWSKRDAAAFRGTELHKLGERIVADEDVEVPEHLHGMAENYAQWLDAWDVRPVAVERPVAHTQHRYAGTFDLIADLRGGSRWLLDLKSGSGVYESHVLQLAGYRHCDVMSDATGTVVPMPHVDRCAVVHVTPDDVVLIPVDAGARAFRTFLHAQQVADWATACSQAYREHRPWPVGRALRPVAA